MGIKKVTFSFDVPIDQLLRIVAEGHTQMGVYVYGDTPKSALKTVNGVAPKLLPAPARPQSIKQVILDKLASTEDHSASAMQLRAAIMAVGYAATSLNNQIFELRQMKLVNSPRRGLYRLTPKGAAMGAAHG